MSAKRKTKKRALQRKNKGTLEEDGLKSDNSSEVFPRIFRTCDNLASRIKKISGPQVESVRLRGDVKAFVKNYFRELRPTLAAESIDTVELDSSAQAMLHSANSRASKKTFLTLFKTMREGLIKIEGLREFATSSRISQGLVTQNRFSHGRDEEIIQTLEKILPSAAICYRQAIEDIRTPRVSYRGSAAELREVLREVLDYLAPDPDVMAAPGFKIQEGTKGPTMQQKVKYILKNRAKSATAIEAPEQAASIVDEGIAKLVRATYNRGSLSTHTHSEGQNEVLQIKMYLDTVLCELLEIH